MKISVFFSRLFAGLGTVLLAAGVIACFWFQGRADAGQMVPRQAAEKSQELMDAISGGDLEGASAALYGNPGLRSGQEDLGEAGKRLWDAYLKSLRCTPKDVCRGTNSGAAQDVTITAMDLDAAWDSVERRAAALLEDMPADPENAPSREVRAQQALIQAADELLQEGGPMVSRDVTFQLAFREGQWWVLPDKTLSAALSGQA